MRFALLASVLAFFALGCGGPRVGSVGAVLSHDNVTGLLLVHEAPEGLAAAAAGIEEGDEVKMIDGVLVDDLSARRIRALLRGPVKSKVTLTIIRGDLVLDVELEREPLGSKAPLKERFERIE